MIIWSFGILRGLFNPMRGRFNLIRGWDKYSAVKICQIRKEQSRWGGIFTEGHVFLQVCEITHGIEKVEKP